MFASFRLKLTAIAEIVRHFQNWGLVLAMRVGLLRLPVFLYRIRKDGHCFEMLARPATKSHSDLFVLREVLIEESYAEILNQFTGKGPLRLIDIGGNIGSFVVWLHRRHGVAGGFSFEPNPVSFNLCRFNLARNQCANVEVVSGAVGGSGRSVTMHVDAGRPGSDSIFGASSADGATVEVEVISFAEFMARCAGSFDVLKVDCEGTEWEILDGTPQEVFGRFGLIVAELHAPPAGPRAWEDFRRRLESYGFRTLRWEPHHMGLYIGVNDRVPATR